MILDIVWIWFSEVKKTLGTSWLHWRRVLNFCNEYLLIGDIHPDGKYKYIPTIYDELPEWCNDSMSDEELDQLAPWNEDVKAELKRRAESSNE